VGQHAIDVPLRCRGVEVGAVVEFDALDQLKDDGVRVRNLPGFGERALDLEAAGGVAHDLGQVFEDERRLGDIPARSLWASEPGGFGQVGCVYTAQGFEYDWNGVIFGPDLVRRGDAWVVQRDQSRDPALRSVNAVPDEELDQLIRNVYKVLLTRGMIGTLIYSTDPETQSFLRSLLDG